MTFHKIDVDVRQVEVTVFTGGQKENIHLPLPPRGIYLRRE
jgi:hypothetical protein